MVQGRGGSPFKDEAARPDALASDADTETISAGATGVVRDGGSRADVREEQHAPGVDGYPTTMPKNLTRNVHIIFSARSS